jgi:hypothetical protein
MRKEGSLEITTLTWCRDTHGLFDYENKSIHKKSFKVSETCSISRHIDDCYIRDSTDIIGASNLLNIEKRGTDFQVSLLEETTLNKMWLVIKEMKKKSSTGYKLNEGDWLKLGRIRLRVQKICLQPLRNSSSILPEFFRKNHEENLEEPQENTGEAQEKSPCRICLNDAASNEDPLICPCKCSGTMKYIHLNCLKEWLKSKVSAKVTDKGMSFHIKDLTCELCKTDFPAYVSQNDQKINLLNINFPTKSYVIIEEFRPDRNSKHALHLICLESGEIGTLGRGHDCDIKISDISVSRKHCKIQLLNGEFFIEDTKSKFGTLAKMKKTFALKPNYDVTVQVNRTVFRLFYKIPWTCNDFCRCFKDNKVFNANLSYLTQPEGLESESELFNFSNSQQHVNPGENYNE